MHNDLNLASTVDLLGAIKAQIADLARREKELAEVIKASGLPVIEGALFRAAVSVTERQSIDTDAVRLMLGHRTPMKSSITETLRLSSR